MTDTPKHEATDAMGMESQRDGGPLTGKSGELKPCSHCGEADDLFLGYRKVGDSEPFAIDCLGCGTRFTSREGSDTRAAWNRRATTQSAEHPCYGEHQPGCDCVIPEQKATPMPSFLNRLSGAAEQSASSPVEGRWYSADDIDRMVRDIDVALNGKEGAAKQARLCDVFPQIIALTTRSVAVSSEAVARIIDGDAFRSVEDEAASISAGLPTIMDRQDDDVVNSVAGLAADNVAHRQLDRDAALAKAEQILSLLNQARKPEGGRHRALTGDELHELLAGFGDRVDVADIAKSINEVTRIAHPAHEAGEVESLDEAAERLFLKQYPGRSFDQLRDQVKIGWMRSAWEAQGAQQ